MKKRITFISTVIATVILFSGCASMSTMQTAKTTEKGEIGYSFGGGYVNTEMPLGETDTLSLKAPILEAGARYGVSENFDVGGKITIIGTAVADAKYQFIGDKNSKFAGSAGLGLGYMSVESGETESKIFDLMVPAYFSYHPADWLAVYSSPKYVYRINSYDTNGETASQTNHWYGVGGGMRIGKKTGVFLEYTYFGNSEFDEPFSQVNAGIGIRIK